MIRLLGFLLVGDPSCKENHNDEDEDDTDCPWGIKDNEKDTKRGLGDTRRPVGRPSTLDRRWRLRLSMRISRGRSLRQPSVFGRGRGLSG